MAIIDSLKDKLGNIIYPKTLTKAIYDENNNRLDNTLVSMDLDLDAHKADNASAHGINLKANKSQEAWISGTLQNGWTGEIKYFKDEFGRVSIQASISPGTTAYGTVITTLPPDYRLIQIGYITVPVMLPQAGKSGLGFYITNTGQICIQDTALMSDGGTIQADFSYQTL